LRRPVGTDVRRLGLVVCVLAIAAQAQASTSGPSLHVVAKNLDNPRKLFLAPGGELYVVEAGAGGSDTCTGTSANAICVGLSGSITKVAGGPKRRVVTGLPSWATALRQRAQGPADVLVRGGTYYVLLGDVFTNGRGANPFGRDGAVAGKLVAISPGRTKPRVIADLGAYEVAQNPDHGDGPGTKFGDPPIDSNPYAFAAFRGGFAVVDAAGNDLLWVSPKGRISVLAVFPVRTEKLSRVDAKRVGLPPTMTSIKAQSVPTCVAVGPDGALYVGELTGRPSHVREARIWRIVPGKPPSLYASGFTAISDIAFDGRDLLVLEIADKGLYDPRSTGALIRLAPDGTRTVLAREGLVYPTGVAVGRRTIYVANYGFFLGSGPGPHGEVVALAR
jgi:hypothetical protein